MAPSKCQKLICAIDQGTSSSRVIVFRTGDFEIVAKRQVELVSIYPEEGWCEQDPCRILETVITCLNGVCDDLLAGGFSLDQIAGIGVTNQRETTVAWSKTTGKPLHNAIVWFDTRTKPIVDEIIHKSGRDAVKDECGLPVSTYFSAGKMKWLLGNVEAVKDAASDGSLRFGTIDSWLLWNLMGGVGGSGHHVTDVTNASRTMLMNLRTLAWDGKLCGLFGIDAAHLPEIRSSAEDYGRFDCDGCPRLSGLGVRVTGCLGDQQAALVGQNCFNSGMAKSTFGTGCFMLYNVGPDVVYSNQGLLSTVAYQLGKNARPMYALEGSIATTGSAINWLANIGIIASPEESETLASKVDDTGGVYFVPAFNGLFAPYWRSDARGTMVGLTQYTKREHICRATLEAVAFQVGEIILSMEKDSNSKLSQLLVDGGMTKNNLFMQILSDLLGISVIRPKMIETTALGAAIAAATTLGLWDPDNAGHHGKSAVFDPKMEPGTRSAKFERWTEAVEKSFGWEKE